MKAKKTAYQEIKDSVQSGELPLDEVLKRMPDVPLTLRVTAPVAMCIEVYAEKNKITRHDLACRLLVKAVGDMVAAHEIPKSTDEGEAA